MRCQMYGACDQIAPAQDHLEELQRQHQIALIVQQVRAPDASFQIVDELRVFRGGYRRRP